MKLCRILFGRDGSIYVPFPYLNEKRGVLTSITDDPKKAGSVTYDLVKDGVVVDYDIKYSHHKSGIVQFSRTSKAEVLPRRTSFPLDGFGGMVFMLHVYFLRGLDHLDSKTRRGELRVGIDFQGSHPFGIRLTAEWVRKEQILNSTEAGTGPVGPVSDTTNRRSGES